MANYNKIIIIGNLTKEPNYKQLQNGQAVCQLTIATNHIYKNKQTGAKVQEVCFIEVDVWGPQADFCRQYLQKGRPVLVEGRLKQDNWEQDGKQRSKHLIVSERVVFLGTAQNAEQSTAPEEFNTPKKSRGSFSGEIAFKDESPFEDDLPF